MVLGGKDYSIQKYHDDDQPITHTRLQKQSAVCPPSLDFPKRYRVADKRFYFVFFLARPSGTFLWAIYEVFPFGDPIEVTLDFSFELLLLQSSSIRPSLASFRALLGKHPANKSTKPIFGEQLTDFS